MTITVLSFHSATEKNPTSKIQQLQLYPYNSEITANSEHGRTLFAPTDYSGKFFCRKIATLFAGLHLIRDRENGADFVLRYNFIIKHNFLLLYLL